MASPHKFESASATSAFDPVAWLHGFTDAGGGYALGADRRLLFGMPADPRHAPQLLSHLDVIHLHPERQDAIRDLIERHQNGENEQ